jgi:hypothetical protein
LAATKEGRIVKLKTALAVVAATFVVAAGAGAEGYQLEFGFAKRAIANETSAVCARVAGCKSWSVRPCRRQSWHRVDCVANYFFPERVLCRQVMIAVWPPWSDHLILHHKRVIC